jgi:hypothetical protein
MSNMNLRYNSLAICGASISLLILMLSAFGSLEIDGSILEAEVLPGDNLSHEINITLIDSNATQNMSVDILGYGQGLGGAVIGLEEKKDSSPYSARSFLTVSPSTFQLKPGVPQKVILDVSIPDNVGSGSMYALAFIHTAPQGNKNVKIITGVNIPVILNIKDTEKTTMGCIEILSAEKPNSSGKLNTSLVFKNTGNTRYNILVEGRLKDINGNVLAEAAKSTFIPILPIYSREIVLEFNLDQKLDPGTYLIEETVNHRADGITIDSKDIELYI